MLHNLLLFGGTFDPVHLGHIQVALKVQEEFNFERFVFLPAKLPPLKERPEASAKQRLAMLELALEAHPEVPFEIDARELQGDGPSYTIKTLREYRQELGKETAITLMMGHDAFADLHHWHQWEQLLLEANILVIHRPEGSAFSKTIQALLARHETSNKADLKTQAFGKIYRFNAGSFACSSSQIRSLIKTLTINKDTQEALPLSPSVQAYIIQHKIYL